MDEYNWIVPHSNVLDSQRSENEIHYSRGKNTYDNRPEQLIAEDFNAFCKDILANKSTIKGQVYFCSGFNEGHHPNINKYPAIGHYRSSSLCKHRRFLPLDFDGFRDVNAFSTSLDYLKSFKGIGYTTASHTEEHPRIRAVLELNREVSREEGIAIGYAFQTQMELVIGEGTALLDPSVYRGEQPCYGPLIQSKTFCFDGSTLNVDTLISHNAAKVNSFETQNYANNTIISRFSIPFERLGSQPETKPYPFTPENANEVFSAAKVLHSNIQNEEEFMIWGLTCANLEILDGWPRTEIKPIFDAICDLAPNANKTLNDIKYESYRKQAENYAGVPRRITSLFYEARERGWKPQADLKNDVIERLNLEYAWIDAEAGIYRLEHRDYISTEKFNAAHANQFTLDNNNKQITVAKKWIADPNRRQHRGIVTRPGEPEITSDGYLNNWKGYAVQPTEGDVTPFKNLNSYLFGDEKYPLNWIAHLIQNPGIKMFPALFVWSSEEGVGKNLFFEAVQNIFPPEHATVISQSEVEDDFSGWIPGTVFVIADEIKAARSDKVRDKLKLWSTATTLRTHDKGQPKRVVPNLMNLVYLSNHPDGLHLRDTDRRFFIWEVTAKPLPQHMINEFVKWRESGGLNHLLHYLQRIDISEFDPKGRAPLTQAKADMVEASFSDLDRWCKDVVMGSISLGKEITTAEYLLNAFCHEFPNIKSPPSVSYVGKTIVRMGARSRKNQVRLTNGRKIRAIALHRPDYWENQNEAAWRDEFERKTFLSSGVDENASREK